MKTFVVKLRPSHFQEERLCQTLETCRHLYNRALGERKDAWDQEQRSINYYAQKAALVIWKADSQYLPQVHSQVLQDVVKRVDLAFQNFFRRVKAKDGKAGYPRFRGAGWYDSFTYPQWGNGVKMDGNRLALSKIGVLKVHKDRPLQGTPKTCTVIRRADGWYASIACEVALEPLPPTGQSIGVDVGISHFATLSNGEQIANPRFYRRAEKSLAVAQRRVSRCKKGSNRRAKAKAQLSRAHLKVKRQRTDFCHKVAHQLIERFDTIAVEDLNIRGMVKNHPLAKSISDAGWGIFLNILSAKAVNAARTVIEVNPAGTSQNCSGCSAKVPKKLSQRWHSCPYCGCELDRDVNAAINILNLSGGGTAFVEPQPFAALKREPHRL